jgi:hypothetical protein
VLHASHCVHAGSKGAFSGGSSLLLTSATSFGVSSADPGALNALVQGGGDSSHRKLSEWCKRSGISRTSNSSWHWSMSYLEALLAFVNTVRVHGIGRLLDQWLTYCYRGTALSFCRHPGPEQRIPGGRRNHNVNAGSHDVCKPQVIVIYRLRPPSLRPGPYHLDGEWKSFPKQQWAPSYAIDHDLSVR